MWTPDSVAGQDRQFALMREPPEAGSTEGAAAPAQTTQEPTYKSLKVRWSTA